MEGCVGDGMWINGLVMVQLLDRAGNIRGWAPPGYSWLEWKLWGTAAGRGIKNLAGWLGARPWPDLTVRHTSPHVVIWDWTYLLGDVLGNHGQCLEVGTGSVGGYELPAYETTLRCKQVVGVRKLDLGYPDWNLEMENGGAIVYMATFPAGFVETEGRITEVCLRSDIEARGMCLAYARLVPGIFLRKGDYLRIQVEVTTAPVAIDSVCTLKRTKGRRLKD
jgi:hypothetical protein